MSSKGPDGDIGGDRIACLSRRASRFLAQLTDEQRRECLEIEAELVGLIVDELKELGAN